MYNNLKVFISIKKQEGCFNLFFYVASVQIPNEINSKNFKTIYVYSPEIN